MDLSDERLRALAKATGAGTQILFSIRDSASRAAIEKCAKVCDEIYNRTHALALDGAPEYIADECAEAIRALLNDTPDEKGTNDAK